MIKNKEEAVVNKALERNKFAGKFLGKIANSFLTEDRFSEKVAANVEQNIPTRLRNELAVTARASRQFARGNFFVVLVSIEQIDVTKMLQSKLDEKQMKRFEQFMHFLGFLPKWIKADLENLILMQAGHLERRSNGKHVGSVSARDSDYSRLFVPFKAPKGHSRMCSGGEWLARQDAGSSEATFWWFSKQLKKT